MTKPCVHLICNAHLDPVWQWRWEEGAAEALSTFRAAADILRDHPRLIFNHNEAILYRWVERYDPVLFEEIRSLVREGRWWIAGGWDLQPDANLPGPEAIVRHMAEGRRYFRERFAVEPRVAYNFDSFGHTAGLPQLLAQAGYRMYIHMRPQPAEMALPSDLYRWRGADGTEILVLRIAVGLYHTEPFNIEERLSQGVDLALRLQRDVPVFWGLGDHGGGATRADLARIDAFTARETRVDLIHSTTDRLHEALREAGASAPIVEGDLQRVFTGCYTSLSRLKRRARESLGRLVQTEALCAAAWWARGAVWPAEELGNAWRDHLFNDFHDILPGSCTESAEADALDLYGRSAETARRLRLGAAAALGPTERCLVPIPVTVVHANPAVCLAPVEAECMLDHRPRLEGLWHLKVLDAGGAEVPCQEEQPESLLPFNGWRRKVVFLARLGGLGARSFRIEARPGAPEIREAPAALPHRIDPAGGLVTSLTPAPGMECLAGALLAALVVKDEGDAWGAGIWQYRDVVGRFAPAGPPRVIARGPVRTVTESTFVHGASRIILHTIAHAAWPVLEFRLRIRWNEERCCLKLSIPTAFRSADALCEVPGGLIRRPCDGQEHVHGRWLLLEGEAAGKPLALGVVNSGQHGLDILNGEARLSVLRSAAFCHEKGFPLEADRAWRFMDQGIHEVRILVTAGAPEQVRAALPGLADFLDAPPAAYSHLPPGIAPPGSGDGLAGNAPQDGIEVLSLEPETVRLMACKRSEDGRALILRLQESAGRPARASLRVCGIPDRIDLPFRPLELKTLRIDRDGACREVDLLGET